MALDYGSDFFTLPPGGSINLTTVFNSNDLNKGGDYMGPLVVAGVTVSNFHPVLTPSTVGLEFTGRHTAFTTFCIYHYSIKNNGAHAATFRIDFFHD
jgi:hypothetical protein